MDITLSKSSLQGTVQVPASKSFAHRQLIAAALADKPTTLIVSATSADIEATATCIEALGARVEKLSDESGFFITPAAAFPAEATLFCNESGSTLRFLLPVAAALGIQATFTGAGRLPQRPNKLLIDAMAPHGALATGDLLPLTLTGCLRGGLYEIAGNVSSQYITGLLLALPLCEKESVIRFTTELESAAYLDITCDVLQQFGISVTKTENGYLIPGGQKYHSPGRVKTEGDWSSAVFWHAANRMGHFVSLQGLNDDSCQGDRLVTWQLDHLGGRIDVSQTPDSLPALAVAACAHPGTTFFTGAARLRIKESDRLSAISNMLCALGQNVEEMQDGLIIHGGLPFKGGKVDGCNDHRIVMAAALAATLAREPVTISGAEAINKSYPRFFEDFALLGGKIHG
ncbi:MAG: 3-phosphoshikimate 1-carboxyvinyltransferase [Clostridia bacterium]|nr:3-phosphoshikimate 1-carboxyvinyltransferase [Clostridia bacterium]